MENFKYGSDVESATSTSFLIVQTDPRNDNTSKGKLILSMFSVGNQI
jgi:hypothetical protein